ncbi:MAG: hypothetical protein KDJ65_19405 [Anaerolineae bacterium]|nr:hypothetical protein [Anaerolineae bacterium]
MNRIWLFLLIVILLITGYLAYHFYGNQSSGLHGTYYSSRYSTAAYTLTGNAQISQEFKAHYPGLDRVDLFFQHQSDDQDGSLIFQLKNSCTSEQSIAQVVVDYAEIVDTQPQPFRFPPLNDSANHLYCFIVLNQSPDPEVSISIYGSNYIDTYPDGQADYKVNTLTLDEASIEAETFQHRTWLPLIQRAPGALETFDVGFNVYYHGPVDTTLAALLSRLAANKPFPFDRAGFYIFLLVLYLVIFGLLVRAASRLRQGPKL